MAAPYPQVVLFGDSIVQCMPDSQDGFSFQAALESHCIRRFDVVNRGLGGYNTSQALRVLPTLFPSPSPAKLVYLVILLGANDAALPRPVGNQHVPIAEYERNLTSILTHPHIQAQAPKIILVTPPTLDGIHLGRLERTMDSQATTSRQAQITAQYAEAARRVAASVPGVQLLDLWTALMDYAVAKTSDWDASNGSMLGDELDPRSQQGHLEKLLWDGLHLTAEGYRVFWGALQPLIELPPDAAETTEGFSVADFRVAPWMD